MHLFLSFQQKCRFSIKEVCQMKTKLFCKKKKKKEKYGSFNCGSFPGREASNVERVFWKFWKKKLRSKIRTFVWVFFFKLKWSKVIKIDDQEIQTSWFSSSSQQAPRRRNRNRCWLQLGHPCRERHLGWRRKEEEGRSWERKPAGWVCSGARKTSKRTRFGWCSRTCRSGTTSASWRWRWGIRRRRPSSAGE